MAKLSRMVDLGRARRRHVLGASWFYAATQLDAASPEAKFAVESPVQHSDVMRMAHRQIGYLRYVEFRSSARSSATASMPCYGSP